MILQNVLQSVTWHFSMDKHLVGNLLASSSQSHSILTEIIQLCGFLRQC